MRRCGGLRKDAAKGKITQPEKYRMAKPLLMDHLRLVTINIYWNKSRLFILNGSNLTHHITTENITLK